MGSKCSNLKELSVSCEDMPLDELAAALGPGTFPLLENFELIRSASIIDDVVAAALCAGHPNLESVSIETGCCFISLASVAVALTHCPRFREMTTDFFLFTTTVESSEQPYFELTVHKPEFVTENLRTVLQSIVDAPHCKHKIRVFQTSKSCEFSNRDVEGIVDVIGKDLRVLDIELEEDVSLQTLERLVRACTELRKLYLEECVAFTDDLMMLLADYCLHIQHLALDGAANITDLAMCYLLQRMGHGLLHLYLRDYPLLTHITLLAITQHCASLKVLDIADTGISADAVITQVIKTDRLPNLVDFSVSDETHETLRAFLNEKENGAHGRWKNMLY